MLLGGVKGKGREGKGRSKTIGYTFSFLSNAKIATSTVQMETPLRPSPFPVNCAILKLLFEEGASADGNMLSCKGVTIAICTTVIMAAM